MVRTLLQVTALSFTLIAAIFLIKSLLRMTPKDMAELSRTRWDYSSPMTRNLAMQKADTIVGFVFLMLSFSFALANTLWPMRAIDFVVNRNGVIIAVLVSFLFFIAGHKVSKILQQHYYQQAMEKLTTEK